MINEWTTQSDKSAKQGPLNIFGEPRLTGLMHGLTPEACPEQRRKAVRACEVQQHVAWGFNFASAYTFLRGTRTKASLVMMLLTFVKQRSALFDCGGATNGCLFRPSTADFFNW
jgi:hypothetical protein